MSASNTLPIGQDHDRGDDAEMQEEEEPISRDASTNTIAVHISAVEEDAMDVTPDTETEELLLPNGSVERPDTTITPSLPPPDNAVSHASRL